MVIEVIQRAKAFIYSRKFNRKQIKEIELGMVEGLDTKYYAKTYFDEYQMREIRYGLEEGIDVKSYAKRCYNSYEMREIRLKLE